MKLHQQIFGIGLLTAVIVPHLCKECYIQQALYSAKADYILALKANHPALHGPVKTWFDQALALKFEGRSFSYNERIEKGHHGLEKRQVWSVPVSQLSPLHQQSDWVGLKTLVMVIRIRRLWNKTTYEIQFYLTSVRL
ncbi:ISAs1 family transposase [Microcoleus sp. Pol12B5]|uniref:ISAs1 family transposase n=1 Tax=Microcoleus sp. Pol12B5 TaxID=3055396 RepID=UPI00403F8AD1